MPVVTRHSQQYRLTVSQACYGTTPPRGACRITLCICNNLFFLFCWFYTKTLRIPRFKQVVNIVLAANAYAVEEKWQYLHGSCHFKDVIVFYISSYVSWIAGARARVSVCGFIFNLCQDSPSLGTNIALSNTPVCDCFKLLCLMLEWRE